MERRNQRRQEILERYAGYPRPDLIWHVISHEVTLRIPTPDAFAEVREWAEQNVGELRPISPFFEALTGWIDYQDGDWAFRAAEGDEPPYTFHFWFFDSRKAVLFALRWKGEF